MRQVPATQDRINHIPPRLLKFALAHDLRRMDIVMADDGEEFPTGLKEFFGTECVDGNPDRPTRCYELSCYALVNAPQGTTLVHGSIHGRGEKPDGEPFERIGHAWLRLRPWGLVWEPYHALLYSADEWYGYSRARDEREFSRTTAGQLVAQHEHTGPWFPTRYR
jgi:hypothetical protein